jgi:hypothetical protein
MFYKCTVAGDAASYSLDLDKGSCLGTFGSEYVAQSVVKDILTT